MKRAMMILIAIALTAGAMAARPVVVHGGGVRGGIGSHPVVVVSPRFYRPSYGFGYGAYAPYWGYNPYYSPYGYNVVPSKLQLNIDEINNDYRQQIAGARHDKSISGSERRSQVRNLRHERDNSIIDAKRNFYHPQRQPEKETDPQILGN